MLGWLSSPTAGEPLATAIGLEAAKKMRKAYGITTVGQMLHMWPKRWIGAGQGLDVTEADIGQIITAFVEVRHVQPPAGGWGPGGGRRPTRLVVGMGPDTITVPVFGNQWLTGKLHPGQRLLVMGTLKAFGDRLELANADLLVLHAGGEPGMATGRLRKLVDAARDVDELTALLARPWIPSHRGRKGIAGITVALYLHRLVRWLPAQPDPLLHPPATLPSFDAALREVHFPGPDGPQRAVWRLKYDEALELQLEMALRRAATATRLAPYCGPPEAIDSGADITAAGPVRAALEDSLPFILTDGQRDVVARIDADLSGRHPMNRLLQGEVGSGKTVVAALGMARVIDAGRQCALLAPTEVLAAQHARTLSELFAPADVRVGLLSGSLPVAERRRMLLGAVTGDIGILVGTHALLSKGVEFFDLGLAVIDEQHRFGVRQRDRLREYGRDGLTPHMLVMTATPIPRTIAMTFFGDLDVSVLRELPGGRSPITSSVVPVIERPAWEDRAWRRIAEEVAAGHRAFIVCPSIVPPDTARADAPAPIDPADATAPGDPILEPRPPANDAGDGSVSFGDEKTDARIDSGEPIRDAFSGDYVRKADEQGDSARQQALDDAPGPGIPDHGPIGFESVQEVYDHARGRLPGVRIGVLHGGMRGEDKDRVMRAFADGGYQVLVSTTVIEVGVDVPEATVMMIRRAESFGVSQLHQLRGRVGRGTAPGLCLLCTLTAPGTPERERLDAIAGTDDGFELADIDLATRHHGDVLGEEQSGIAGAGILNVAVDGAIIARARRDAAALVERDPARAMALTDDITREESEFLDRG